MNRKPITLPRTPKDTPIPIKNIDLYEEETYEEGHSQMIEREDIENSYNMLIGAESSSEDEELSQHLEIMK